MKSEICPFSLAHSVWCILVRSELFFVCLRCLEDLLCADIDFDLPNAGQYFRSVMEGFEKDDYETVVFNVSSVFTLTYY